MKILKILIVIVCLLFLAITHSLLSVVPSMSIELISLIVRLLSKNNKTKLQTANLIVMIIAVILSIIWIFIRNDDVLNMFRYLCSVVWIILCIPSLTSNYKKLNKINKKEKINESLQKMKFWKHN